MKSALCVFFILIIRERSGAQGDDFRPTPIPLGEWKHDKETGRAGTLHETFKTDSPQTVAAVPAHYWEDALKHSVYLTLVRDKIDLLIAKGEAISAESDTHKQVLKEVDDHDLWEKIKSAPFDRIKEEEQSSTGDVTTIAKGRLLEEKGGFRFSEDDKTKGKCNEDQCMQGVKAIWSVKRVRQRDHETSPDRYHYELTFSVVSQPPKKQKKPYENSIRTFTVRESNSNKIVERPHEFSRTPPTVVNAPRPNRAIWFHKNIVPTRLTATPTQYKTHRFDAFDRIFSSLFSDDDDISHEPPKYKPNNYVQHSKAGYVASPTDQYPQVNVMHYPYRPHQNKYSRPPVPTSSVGPNLPMRPHMDLGSISVLNNGQIYNLHDYKGESNFPVKTTRPAVLPTPLPSIAYKDQSIDVTNAVSFESTENATKIPEYTAYKPTTKYKPTPVKVNYFTDHVRPPIYNAPPGVFVTMDKKPFKPMPPMKLMQSKPHKTNRPIDFRPSPQVHDTEPTDADPFSDTAFRPISINFSDRNITGNDFNRKPEHKHRKPGGKKPSKKHENNKSQIITTSAPDIITAQTFTDDGLEGMDWMSYLGAFTKTTPMASLQDKINETEYSTPTMTLNTETLKETTVIDDFFKPLYTPIITTTSKPKKRTRPPPKFNKQDKVKKFKRITTPSTTTTSTIKPRAETIKMIEAPIKRKPAQDLTPLASSAPTGTLKPILESKNITVPVSTSSSTTTTTTTTTTTSTPSTTKKPITTRSTTISTTTRPSTTPYQPRNRNRFRQSTLLIKGTSVKHDRWSVIGLQKNSTNTSTTPSLSSYRRKGSNFQGYSSTITPRDESTEKQVDVSSESSTIYENYETNSVIPLDYTQNENGADDDEESVEAEKDDGETSDHDEFIFPPTVNTDKRDEGTRSVEQSVTTAPNIQISNTPQNKTKCKKKKNNTTTEEPQEQQIIKKSFNSQVTTSENPTTNDIFQDFLNFDFIDDDKSTKQIAKSIDEDGGTNHGSYLKIDDDLNDFFGILDENTQRSESSADDSQYEEDISSFDDDENSENENSYEEEDSSYNDESRLNDNSNLSSNPKKPISFLELIAMA